jgi:hypothetical protein
VNFAAPLFFIVFKISGANRRKFTNAARSCSLSIFFAIYSNKELSGNSAQNKFYNNKNEHRQPSGKLTTHSLQLVLVSSEDFCARDDLLFRVSGNLSGPSTGDDILFPAFLVSP